MPQQGCVGVNHALGGARRARRVHNGQRIRFIDVVFHRLEQRGVDHVAGFGVDQDVAQQRGSVLDVGESLPVVVRAERRSGKEDFGVAVDELCGHLRSRGECRERYDDGADARGGEHAYDERLTVGVEQPDVSALSRAEGNQTASQLCRPVVGLRVAEALDVAHEKRVLSSVAGLAAQNFGDGQRFTWHVRRDS